MVVFNNFKESKFKQIMAFYETYMLLTIRVLALRESKRGESEPVDTLGTIYAYRYNIIDHSERETSFTGFGGNTHPSPNPRTERRVRNKDN